MHLLLPLHYALAEILLHWHSNWFLVLSPLWLEHYNEVLTGTIVELAERETLFQLKFELLSHLRLSQYTIGIPNQSSNDLCSSIHLWSLRYHQFLLFLFCLCGWDCASLEVLLGIHVSIFSTHSLSIIVHIFVSLSIHLNHHLQWNLLFSHLFQESCCLVLIHLTGCHLQLKLRGDCSNWSQHQAVFLQVRLGQRRPSNRFA